MENEEMEIAKDEAFNRVKLSPVDSLVICPSCEGLGEDCQLCDGSGKVKKLIADTMARVTPLSRKTVVVSTP